MRQAVIAQVLAPVVQILRLRRAAVVDALLDPAADMAAVDRQHRLDIAVARRADQHRQFVRHGRVLGFIGPIHSETT